MRLPLSVLRSVLCLAIAAASARPASAFNGSDAGLGNVSGEVVPDGAWYDICLWGDWSSWATCVCDGRGIGTSSRSRAVLWQSQFAGSDCTLLGDESLYCSSQCVPHSVHCEWSQWDDWSACTCSADIAKSTRRRSERTPASYGGDECTGAASEEAECQDAEGCSWDYSLLVGLAVVGVCLVSLVAVWKVRRRRSKVVPKVVDEEAEDSADDGDIDALRLLIPGYWANSRNVDHGSFHELVYVDSSLHAAFDELLSETYLPRCSQDRPCPRGTCPKTPRGCPCAQPEGEPGLPVGYRVRRVMRLESTSKWRRYCQRRTALAELRGASPPDTPEPPLRSSAAAARHPDVFAPLVGGANEVYALHGTSVRSALSIALEDFRVDLAGSGAGTMYGMGCYLAESSTKADEYARDEADGPYKGIYAMLLSRVAMGRFYYTTERDPRASQLVASGEFDSTFGDRERCVGTFREMVVYNTEQAYPEYIVIYQRVHRADDLDAVARACLQAFHLEVPIYWKSCHRQHGPQAFCQQLRVRRSTLALLDRLALKSSAEVGWHVVRARRVENSGLWSQYSRFKASLRERLVADAEDGGLGGPSPSFARSATFDGQVISVEHLEVGLGERFLWHGTCKEAAEKIAVEGFAMPPPQEAEGRKRFGRGIYFAESLDKSLAYADEQGGICFVLLCRVACGRSLVTTELENRSANVQAEADGFDSVLGELADLGLDREIVALREEQAYPEYIVEMSRNQGPPADGGPPPPPSAEPPAPQPTSLEGERPEAAMPTEAPGCLADALGKVTCCPSPRPAAEPEPAPA